MKYIKRNPHLLILCIATLYFFALSAFPGLHYSWDFVPVYTGGRCLLHGCNPYDPSQLEQQYIQAGGRRSEQLPWHDEVPVYPPSTLLVISPLAVFRFPLARLLWFLLNGCVFVAAAAVILSMCPKPHRWFATVLVSIIVASSRTLLILGQPSIVAISLLVIGVYLLLHGRRLPLAACLLVLSLALKPQIGGLIVLYFLVKKLHWRYAALAMAGAFALLLSAGLILKMHPRSANWTSDLRANISTTVKPGGVNDPRPANQSLPGQINLQAVTSVFFADSWRFNAIAYAIFLALLAVWIVAILRAEESLEMHLLALGALAALSLMPVYHRSTDSRLLLLTVPAALIIFQKRRLLGAFACALTILPNSSIQDRVQLFLLHHGEWQRVLQNKFLFVLLLRQQNLKLPILFCLCVAAIFFIRFSEAPTMEPNPAHFQALPPAR